MKIQIKTENTVLYSGAFWSFMEKTFTVHLKKKVFTQKLLIKSTKNVTTLTHMFYRRQKLNCSS